MARPVSPDLTRNAYAADTDLAAHFRVSRATIRRWANERQFPAPVKLSPQITRWRWADVQAWEVAQDTKTGKVA
jgi:prophage regulatory protein